jgi:alcohol dehydrogenase
MMKAFVYRGVGLKAVEERPKPELQAPGDAIVRLTRTTICGGDLHILRGDVPTCEPGRILGHEGIGVVEAVGPAVTRFRRGDHVLISSVTSCGKCAACRRGMYSHCESGGWILGHRIDGTHAEYVRTPHADTSLYAIPPGQDEDSLLMLCDVLPTGFECGVLNGRVDPGSTIAIVGAGPIGLATLLTAQLHSPAEIIVIDVDDNRLDTALTLGATATVNGSDGKAADTIRKLLTGGRGVDTAIETAGRPAAFQLCQDIIAPGGTIACIAGHGTQLELELKKLRSANVTITTRLVDTVTTPILLKTIESCRIDPSPLITHHFGFDQILDAYETFRHAAETQALKVVVTM